MQSTHYIILTPDLEGKVSKAMTLSAPDTDFKVTKLVFKPTAQKDQPTWQKDEEIPFAMSVTKSDTKDDNGYYSYRIEFDAQYSPTTTTNGSFLVSTNNSQVPEIKIRGLVRPRKK